MFRGAMDSRSGRCERGPALALIDLRMASRPEMYLLCPQLRSLISSDRDSISFESDLE